LANHALGLVSIAIAEDGLRLTIAFWRTWPATLLLYGAAAIHFALALWTLCTRRDWKLPAIEIVRLASGFSLPTLLIGHAVTTRLGDTLYALQPSYGSVITDLLASGTQGLQLALLAPGWLHGALGLWITLRRFETMQRLKPLLVALVVLVPLLAAAGFLRMASEVQTMPAPPAKSASVTTALAAWKSDLTAGYLGTIAAAIVLGRLYAFRRRRSS
jgi:adenylate cyclase